MSEPEADFSALDKVGVPCTLMRGGTSKGAYFLRDDLPSDAELRDALLMSVMGSPDHRQIDGIGGADPLTSKVAIVGRSERDDADIDYLFLQVFVDQPIVSSSQNCGNILSGVAQFAVEKGLIQITADGMPEVKVYLVNSDQVARIRFPSMQGLPLYAGNTRIDGVPFSGAAVLQDFPEAAGSTCGALLPTGNPVDRLEGVECTLIDNGMPVVVMAASDLGIEGDESRETLEGNVSLRKRLEEIRLAAGPLMNLGEVAASSVPKMTMVSAPRQGGVLTTRTFIPHRCHASIGVFGAISVATACLLPEGPAARYARFKDEDYSRMSIEHPSGEVTVLMDVKRSVEAQPIIRRAEVVRTARKLFEGRVYPHHDWRHRARGVEGT